MQELRIGMLWESRPPGHRCASHLFIAFGRGAVFGLVTLLSQCERYPT